MLFSALGRVPVSRRNCSGSTLVEMLVVLLIALVLAVQATPSLTHLLASARLRWVAVTFYSHLQLARNEAIKRNSREVLCPSSNGQQCLALGNWGQGWIVFNDANDNAQRDPGETIIAVQSALHESVRFAGNTNVAKYVSYAGDGSSKLASGAFQAGHFTICTASAVTTDARLIYLSKVGHARMVKNSVAQC